MESKEMKKTMGAAVALSMVVGCVIGSGVFFKPQAIYTATGGASGIGILSWIIGGLITLCAGLTVAEIAVVIWGKSRIFNWLDAMCTFLSWYSSSTSSCIW